MWRLPLFTIAWLIALLSGSAILLTNQDASIQAFKSVFGQDAPHLTQPLAAAKTDENVPYISGNPTRIVIEGLGIDLQVVPGVYDQTTKNWSLSLDRAHFADVTTAPNNKGGNSFIYGHNRKGVLSSLSSIQMNQEAKVYADNGYIFTYMFVGAVEVSPNDTSIFNYQGEPILTIQTCSGSFYQNRQLFTFRLKDVVKQ